MATTTSQIRTVVTALYDLLVARPALSGVTIFRYAPSPRDAEAREYVALATRVDGVQRYEHATNRVKRDTYTLRGELFVQINGAGDAVADEAHARAEVLLAEIEAALQSNVTLGQGHTTTAELGDYEHVYGGDDSHRNHLTRFAVDVNQRLVSTS